MAFALILAATLLTGSPLQAAASVQAAASQPATGDRLYMLSFSNGDAREVAEAVLGRALGLRYQVDPLLRDPVTFQVSERLSREQLLARFEAALARSGAALVRRDGLAIVEPATVAAAEVQADALASQRAESGIVASVSAGSPTAFVVPPQTSAVSGGRTFLAGMVAVAGALALARLGFWLTRRRRPSPARGATTNRSPRQAVLDRLLEDGAAARAALPQARCISSESGRPLDLVLRDLGAVDDEALAEAFAAVTGYPRWRPDLHPALGAESDLGPLVARLTASGALPILVEPDRVTVAMGDPLDDGVLVAASQATGRSVRILVATLGEIEEAQLSTVASALEPVEARVR